MSELTRRSFVRSGAGAAAGMAALGTLGVAGADAKKRASHSKPVVAWLGDPRDGKITIMAGDEEITVTDHELAAKIADIAKHAKKQTVKHGKQTTKHAAKHTAKHHGKHTAKHNGKKK